MRQFAPILLVLVSAAVAACACLQAFHYPFFGDDVIYVVMNNKLASLHPGEIWRLFVEPYNEFTEFLPLRDFSYWLDFTLFGTEPAGFRIQNVLWYLACLPLIYGLTAGLWRYFRPAEADKAPWIAAVTAALFAVHPTHVEAVIWIAGRKDVLAAVFSLLALWLALRVGEGRRFSSLHATAALAVLVAGILSKATAAAVAPVIALLWLIFWREMPKQDRRPLLLLWPLAAIVVAMVFALIFGAFMKFKAPFYFGIEAVTRSLAALGWLARLAISPEDRHFYYPVFEDPWFPYMVALGVLVLVATIAGTVVAMRKRSLAAFALAAFLLLCLPSIQLIPYAPPSLISDRFLTIAVWPVILLIVAASWRLGPLPRTVLLLVLATAWTAQSIKHPLNWSSAEVLMDYESRSQPGYAMPAAYKIINFQLPQGSYGVATETADSIANPQIKDALVKLIRTYQAVRSESNATGSPADAMDRLSDMFQTLKRRPAQYAWDPSTYNLWETIRIVFEQQWVYLLKRFPNNALVSYNGGLWMVDTGYYGAAIVHLRAAAESRLLPDALRGRAFEKLGLSLLATGQYADAEVALLAALKQPRHDARTQCLLATVYKRTGRLEEAARAEAQCINAPGGNQENGAS